MNQIKPDFIYKAPSLQQMKTEQNIKENDKRANKEMCTRSFKTAVCSEGITVHEHEGTEETVL